MYKNILTTYASDPKHPTATEKELALYLDNLRFEERLKGKDRFTNNESKEIFKDFLSQYAEGKRNQEFVISLGSIFYPLVYGGDVIDPDEDLLDIGCQLSELALPSKEHLTEEEKDIILKNLLKIVSSSLANK